MKIVLAADSVGKPLLDVMAGHLVAKSDLAVTDMSEAGFYADIAAGAAKAIMDGAQDRGILFCGTGIGVCISANKVPGIRAALTHDTYSADRAAKSNNAQIITMGARVIGPELAKAIVDACLAAEFDPIGPSAGNVAAVDRLDTHARRSARPRRAKKCRTIQNIILRRQDGFGLRKDLWFVLGDPEQLGRGETWHGGAGTALDDVWHTLAQLKPLSL